MTHAKLKDYSNSPTPAFDAVEDVMDALGPDWDYFRRIIGADPNAHRRAASWKELCREADISHPFQIQAWYDHHFGSGAWLAQNAIELVGRPSAEDAP